jgi:hypothetical protein
MAAEYVPEFRRMSESGASSFLIDSNHYVLRYRRQSAGKAPPKASALSLVKHLLMHHTEGGYFFIFCINPIRRACEGAPNHLWKQPD